jgi:hypothetical protein
MIASNQHLLVALCGSTPLPPSRLAPEEGIYNTRLGLWLDASGSPIVNSLNRPRPRTKKEDVETGEDHKGT